MKIHPRLAGGLTGIIIYLLAFLSDKFFNTLIWTKYFYVLLFVALIFSGIVTLITSKSFYSKNTDDDIDKD